jgi:hypothetical protein
MAASPEYIAWYQSLPTYLPRSDLAWGAWQAAMKLSEEKFNSSAQGGPTNTQIMPCPCCGEPWDIKNLDSCECGALLVRS